MEASAIAVGGEMCTSAAAEVDTASDKRGAGTLPDELYAIQERVGNLSPHGDLALRRDKSAVG